LALRSSNLYEKMNQFPSRWAITGIILFAASAELAEGVIQDESKPIDCGVNALFLLLDLEGRTVTLDRLESTLPPPHPEGYSMAELAQTSAGLGLSLDGIRFMTRPPCPEFWNTISFSNPRSGQAHYC
jgi:hypothetical protein